MIRSCRRPSAGRRVRPSAPRAAERLLRTSYKTGRPDHNDKTHRRRCHAMSRRQFSIIAAAGLVFALIFGVRQSVALFIGPMNSATGLGIASISLAFACAQLMWGVTQPMAGAMADKYGTGRVVATGGVLVMLGTIFTPYATSTWMLIVLIGVIAAGGAGMVGLGVLMSAVGRAV